jgi:hypothetical protein
MPPKSRKKAPAVKQAPAAPANPKVRKRGPSNADENATKPTAKKARKANNEPADDDDDDDDDAENEGGTAKAVKMTRVKKLRCAPLFFFQARR